MPECRVSTDFVLIFAPERWSSIAKFRQMMGSPFKVNRELQKGVSSAENHLSKFGVLAGLANRLKERLPEDQAELAEKGYTPAIRSREFAALVESLFCELYAALDGVRRTLYAAYKNVKGVQNQSIKKLFERANENKYGPEFPEDIRAALAAAFVSWFPRLRSIRTEVTHGDIGSCHLNEDSGKVFYMHGGLGPATRALVIEDVVAELNQNWASVFELVEDIFRSLCAKLEPVERTAFCGIYKGRCYQRKVAPAADLTFNSGRCRSCAWFENEPGYECPLRHSCGAHLKRDELLRPAPPNQALHLTAAALADSWLQAHQAAAAGELGRTVTCNPTSLRGTAARLPIHGHPAIRSSIAVLSPRQNR